MKCALCLFYIFCNFMFSLYQRSDANIAKSQITYWLRRMPNAFLLTPVMGDVLIPTSRIVLEWTRAEVRLGRRAEDRGWVGGVRLSSFMENACWR